MDTAALLFYARGVHAVGMDELITSTGLAKMSVYRLFPTKDDLVGAYLSAANLGPDGPAAAGLALARTLVRTA